MHHLQNQVGCLQSVFLSKFSRGYEAKRFSLKKNGTRLVRVSPHSLLDHSVLLRSRYNSSLKPKLIALLTTSFAQFSSDIWESMASTCIEDCRNLTCRKTLAYLKNSNKT